MNKGKKIEANLSSLVDLKAELFRKQEEAKRNVERKDPLNVPLKLTGKIKDKLIAHDKRNVQSIVRGTHSRLPNRPPPDENDNEEVRKALEASRKKLEEKAKLYEKLSSTSNFNDEEELFMVDFNRKSMNREARLIQNPAPAVEPDIIVEDEASYKANNESEEWVEYTDSLGRTRKCFKKDLPEMKAMDMELQRLNAVPPPSFPFHDDNEKDVYPQGISEPTNPPPSTGPIHYQNVQHNEIRNHGVGYYGFSVDEENRAKQQEQLDVLRNQTKEQRLRREKLKEQRKTALKERLKKVKQRKLMKTGEEISSDSDSNYDEAELLPEKKEEVPQNVQTQDQKPPTVRPWDRGKIGTKITQPFKQATQRNWIEQQRSDRPAEFAPPQFYSERDHHVESIHQFFKQKQMDQTSNNVEDIPLP